MKDKLKKHLDAIFSSYSNMKNISDLKEELLVDLTERFNELKSNGFDDETAYKMSIDSIGDIDQTLKEISKNSNRNSRKVSINLTAIDLKESDFAGAVLHKGKFKASSLKKADFSNADLTGSIFEVSDARDANFDGANLTDCVFSMCDLKNASFRKSLLLRTSFSMTGQGAIFSDINLVDVRMNKADLRKTIFDNCSFDGVDFEYCDMRNINFDGLTFSGVKFFKSSLKDISFRGATLKNVSFTPPFSLTNKYYQQMKTICFDGASMDKLTYAVLKGLRVIDLSNVKVIDE